MNIPTIAAPGALPQYAHPGDAGADLRAAHDVALAPGERGLVGTGVAVALPEGYVGLVTPRSGLAAKAGLSIVNAQGSSTPATEARSRCASSIWTHERPSG